MIVAAVADSATIARLDEYRAMTARLADPRGLAPAERARLIKTAKPIYWLTGSIHSPETGSPEMLMELLYRLAVEESPFVQKIRNNVITLITPVVEADDRKIGDGKPGPITRKLQKLFFDAVHGRNPQYRHWLTPVN